MSMTESEIFDKMLDARMDEYDELLAYRAIGTVEEFKALKEKNTPKKVKGISLTHEGHVGNCPTCGKFIRYCEQKTYCVCGQKLDWGNE